MFRKSCMKTIPLAAAITAAWLFGAAAQAQTAADTSTAPLTRAEVKMETAEFLKTHQFDEARAVWELKPGFEPPAGVKPRAEVKAERDAFLRTHRYQEPTGWVELKPGPRNLGTMTRAQLAAETKQFLATHTFDELKGVYVETEPRKMRRTK